MIDSLPLLTHSERNCFKSCARRWQFAYLRRMRRAKKAKPLRMGSVIHESIDVHARSGSRADAIERAKTMIADDLREHEPETLAEWSERVVERQQIIRLLDGYFEYWGANCAHTILASEEKFRLPLRHPDNARKTSRTFEWGGMIDRVVKLRDGRGALKETKTTAGSLEAGSDYWSRLLMDGQIAGYSLAANMLGLPVETVLYDVIRKPSTEPRKLTQAETKKLLGAGEYWWKPKGESEAIKVGVYEFAVADMPPSVDLESGMAYVGMSGSDEDLMLEPGANEGSFSAHENSRLYGDRLAADIRRRPEWYFARREVPMSEERMRAEALNLWHDAKQVISARNDGHFSQNTSACNQYGRCTYFDLCAAGIEDVDPNSGERPPDGFEFIENSHPELA